MARNRAAERWSLRVNSPRFTVRLPPWVTNYDVRTLRKDAVAGLTVAVLLVPQAMAYAMLGGVPPVVGLYASFLPLILYAILGTSRQLAVGPTAMDSLLVMAGASAVAPIGSAQFLAAATILAGLAGVLQFGMGALRLGFLVNFLSRPVIGGFTTAAALVIAGSQLGAFAGVESPRASTLHRLLEGLAPAVSHVHVPTLILSSVSLLALLALKRWAPKLPGSLLVVAGATLTTAVFRLDRLGVRVVGQVPNSLPELAIPTFDMQLFAQLLPTGAMLALVGFMEAISVAKAIAEKHGQTIDADREMLALGLANFGAFFSGAYPVTGGFSRSAVADEAGAQSKLTGVFAALGIGATLLWLTPLFFYLPHGTLAALVLLAASGLLRGREAIALWKIRRVDAALWVVTLLVTLFVGIGQGILAGVFASLAMFIRRSTQPHTAELGRLPGTSVFRNLKHYPEAELIPGVLILRMDASLYFANTAFFKEQVAHYVNDAQRPVQSVLIDASSINDLDCSGEVALRELAESLGSAGRKLYFGNVKHPVAEVMQRSGFMSYLGEDHFFLTLSEAVSALVTPRQTDIPTDKAS